MFTFDQRRNIPLLVDTGSAVSIAPTRLATSIDQTAARNLRSFGGTNIFSPGTSHLQLDLGYGPFQAHPFCIVDGPMDHLILGIDFLRRNNLTFGVPTTLISDNGGEFASAVFVEFCRRYGINHKFTTPYHPSSNGFVERFHRTLKQSLRALEHADSWATHIPDIILFLNSLPSDGNAFTPFQMTFGQSSNVPGICSLPNEADTSSPAAEDVYAFFHNMGLHYRKARPLPTKHYVHADLNEAKFVWIKNSTRHHPLSPLYKGPFRVLSRTEKWLEVYTDSYIKRVSVDNTKPAFGFSEEASTDDESPAEEEPVLQPEEWLQRRSTSSGRAINRPAWMRDYQ